MYSGNMYAYGMAFNINKETVLDAIHDVFLHIIEREKEIDTESNVKFYLLISLRNRLFSIKRKEMSTQSIDDVENSNFTLMVNKLEDIVEDEEERNELTLRIEEILNELTSRQREVIYLRYMQNFSYEEIAEMFQISPKAVRKLNYRALSRIKELYGIPITVFLQIISLHVPQDPIC